MNVLVTGAGGYIGIPLVNELIKLGHEVVCLDRWFFGQFPKTPNCVKMDIRDCELDLGPEWSVIDLAGLSNDASAEIDPRLTQQINEYGGKRLATIAKKAGVRRYVYSSSASVYGAGDKQGLTETDELHPLTAYAKSKVAVEQHLLELAGDGFEPVILRNATVFGLAPRMRFDLAVNVMTLRAYRDSLIYVMGGGAQNRPFVHVSDVVRAFVLALETPDMAGQTYNVGSDDLNCTIRYVAGLVHSHFPEAELHVPPEDTDRRDYHLSFAKIKALGFETKKAIEDGIFEIKEALERGLTDSSESYTVQHYKSMIRWEKTLDSIRLNGRIL